MINIFTYFILGLVKYCAVQNIYFMIKSIILDPFTITNNKKSVDYMKCKNILLIQVNLEHVLLPVFMLEYWVFKHGNYLLIEGKQQDSSINFWSRSVCQFSLDKQLHLL